MIHSMVSNSSSSSATVRVEKATSEFLIGPDWTTNIDICDAINSNQMLAKDIVKAVKKRLQHKNPKVHLLALTLLETMVKNCGDYVHLQIAEKNILQDMVKIVKKKTDMHVRDKILSLIGSWQEAFGGAGGRYPQYCMAYEDLRRSGVAFPLPLPDAAPIFTPPVTHPLSMHPQPGYGMPSGSSRRLDEAMTAEENMSLSSIESMREVLNLLIDMLQAIDPNNRLAVKDEVIVDLVEQCHANEDKLMKMLMTTGDGELLGQGLELNDTIQSTLAKHDAIASGSPLPPKVLDVPPDAVGKHYEEEGNVTSSSNSSMTVLPEKNGPTDEEEEGEDEFVILARRHLKNHAAPHKPSDINGLALSKSSHDVTSSESPRSSPITRNALVPLSAPDGFETKDQDILDLLSLTITTTSSTEQTSETYTSSVQSTPHGHLPSASSGPTFSTGAYPGNPDVVFNNYVAPWAQQKSLLQPPLSSHTLPQFESREDVHRQPTHQPQQQFSQNATQQRVQPLPSPQPQFPQYSTVYPPPPWASTPGYFSNPNPVTKPVSTYLSQPSQQESFPGEAQVNTNPRLAAANAGQKPFIPSYRLFEDLNIFGSEGAFKASNHSSPSMSGSNNQSLVRKRK